MRLVPVQHHHAHVASCLADNEAEGPVIGVSFDGTGMGADGKIWGGEFLVADYRSYRRTGHLEYLPLPGGDAAIKRPYRTAIGYVLTLLGEDALNALIAALSQAKANQSQLASIARVSEVEMEVIKRQIERGINSPITSSMGRLFDAVSAVLGIRGEIDYEGQAAVELEMAAYSGVIVAGVSDEAQASAQEGYPYRIVEDEGIRVVRVKDLLAAIIEDMQHGTSIRTISVRFHNTVAQLINEMCQLVARETGITQVALSGGVFQNRLLLRKAIRLLEGSGLHVLTHRQVPCNDGGVSLGQAAIAGFAV
jgi:hydrogenase maturation protein HypF